MPDSRRSGRRTFGRPAGGVAISDETHSGGGRRLCAGADVAPMARQSAAPVSLAAILESPARVTGYLFARRGGGYGHLGAYRYMLVADAIEYL